MRRWVPNTRVGGPCPTGGLFISPSIAGKNQIFPDLGKEREVPPGTWVYVDPDHPSRYYVDPGPEKHHLFYLDNE